MLRPTTLRRWAARGAVGVVGAAGVAYASSPGFRRSVTFWSSIAPFYLEHRAIKARAAWDGADAAEVDARLAAFHERSAERAVELIVKLGGIYVKIGQFASTMGAAILADPYVDALRVLQVRHRTITQWPQPPSPAPTLDATDIGATGVGVALTMALPMDESALAALRCCSCCADPHRLRCLLSSGRGAAAAIRRRGGDHRGERWCNHGRPLRVFRPDAARRGLDRPGPSRDPPRRSRSRRQGAAVPESTRARARQGLPVMHVRRFNTLRWRRSTAPTSTTSRRSHGSYSPRMCRWCVHLPPLALSHLSHHVPPLALRATSRTLCYPSHPMPPRTPCTAAHTAPAASASPHSSARAWPSLGCDDWR